MKKIITTVVVLSMLFTLAACGSNSGSTGTAGSAPAAASTAQPNANDGKVYNLKASFHSPEANSSVIYTKAWCEEITKASNGRIQWTYFTSASLTSSGDTFNHARDGVADVTWTTPVLVGAQMKANSLLIIPYSGWPIDEKGGEIAWNLLSSSEDMKKEWEGVKVISYYPMGATVLTTSDKKINSAADLKSMPYRATNAVTSAFVSKLGANPVIVSTSDVYESLSKNVIAGSLIDWNLINSFRLFEVLKYAVEDTLYSNVGNIVMNNNSYNNLPEDLQAIIDEHSGMYASKMGARMTAEFDNSFKQKCIENGLQVAPASAELKKEIEEAGKAAVEVFKADCEKAGIDTDKLIALYVQELEKFGYTSPIFSK